MAKKENIKQEFPRLSYWEREIYFKNIDIAIVGSGIVGLSAAISIKERNPDLHVIVFERGGLPMGASTRNAGFACFGSMTELIDDIERVGENETFALVERRYKGLLKLRNRIPDAVMSYRHDGGYEIFRTDEPEIFEACVEKMNDFNRFVKPFTNNNQTYTIESDKAHTFRFRGISHIIQNNEEGILNTGKMMQGLVDLAKSMGVLIYNGIGIDEIEPDSQGVLMQTIQGWEIRASKVVVAVNGFAKKFFPEIELTPARNQVMVTQPIKNLAFKGAFHYDRGFYYFRELDGRVLIGGGRNLSLKEEETSDFGMNQMIQSALSQLLRTTILPDHDFEIDCRWSGILGLGPQKKPIVAELRPHVFAAVRMGGMGVALGSLVGDEVAAMVL